MRAFYLLLGNTLIASVTNFTVWFAITFFVYLETRSVFATSIIGGIYLVLVALSGFWFGSLVDHYRKKQVMLASSLTSLGIYLATFALYVTADPDTFKNPASVTLWVFVLLLMVGVIAGNIRTIALPTLVTILIPEERRDKANGLAGTAAGISFLITSVISGLLVGLGGMYYVLILAVVMTSLAIIHLWTITIPEREIVHSDAKPREIDIRGTITVISAIPGLVALILFTTFNNFLGGIYFALMDAYGLSLVSVQVWGLLWGFLSLGFIIGGLIIARWGLGRNPLRALFAANITIWTISSFFTIVPSIVLLTVGMFVYLCVIPFIEAAEQTILQKVVPPERQGRVFGFAQSVEQAASPLTAFVIGPIAQFIFIPFMTTGAGVDLIGGWFGVGADRGIALVFTLTGIIGLGISLIALRSPYYRQLSQRYAAPMSEGNVEHAQIETVA
jgi:MFS transporter, DHA3 family, multidrug efflux protein